jgi:hypothetical protein
MNDPISAAEQIPGYIAAFLTAMLVIAVDCNSALKKAIGRVPIGVLRSSAVWLLCMACGVVAAICFHFSWQPSIKEIVDLKWQSSTGRGIAVGLAVLTILRSRFFNFKDTEIGGEYFYNAGRTEALQRLYDKWTATKARYTTPEIVSKACGRVSFEDDLLAAVRNRTILLTDLEKQTVEAQILQVQKTRPAAPIDCADPKWSLYFRTLINLALDNAGTKALIQFDFFPKP